VQCAQNAIDANPTVTGYRNNQAFFFKNLGIHLGQLGRHKEALDAFWKSVGLLRPLADADPTDVMYRRNLVASYAGVASALVSMGKAEEEVLEYDKAARLYRESITILQELEKPTATGHDLYNLACGYAVLHGLARKKVSDQISAEAEAAGEQAVAMLRRAIAAGFRDAAHMRKDTDLDSMRERPDFEKLLADLEKEIKASKK
jgi:tetratricopeptide (TPR) repeat protein